MLLEYQWLTSLSQLVIVPASHVMPAKLIAVDRRWYVVITTRACVRFKRLYITDKTFMRRHQLTQITSPSRYSTGIVICFLGGGLFSIILTNGYVDGIKKAWHTEGVFLLPFTCYMLHSALGGAYEYT